MTPVGPRNRAVIAARLWTRLDRRSPGRRARHRRGERRGRASCTSTEPTLEALAMVSHELRNPLTAIALTASALERNVGQRWFDAADAQRALTTIQRASARMSRMLDDLLAVARLERGTLIVHPRPADAAAMVHEAAAEAALEAHAKAVRLRVSAEARPIVCDRQRVLQVLSNLLANAIKFTPPGGSIDVETSRERDGAARFVVRDSGPGIAAHELARVFDRYWQRQPGAHDGLGLGLAIAKAIVEAHGGRIWAASEIGCGTTFAFELPVTA